MADLPRAAKAAEMEKLERVGGAERGWRWWWEKENEEEEEEEEEGAEEEK